MDFMPIMKRHHTLRVGLGVPLILLTLLLFSSATVMGKAPGFGAADKAWAQETLQGMSLRDKVGQLIMIRIPGKFLNHLNPQYAEVESQIQRMHVGGIILFAGHVYESAVLINDLQNLSQLPLLVAADFEWGVAFRIADSTSFPSTMAIGATRSEEFAYSQGAITAREARALGVHWVYAPVMDVNSNPDNPVINIRSYGEDASLVARLGAAFIRGCRDNGVFTTAKHFPGHGDTAADSHIGLAVVPADRARLNSVELVPFRSAIEAGVDSIMTAHVAVPRVTGEPDIPATLSRKIMTDLLRKTLHFEGLLVTDAMEMGAITKSTWTGRAAVEALRAGADMLILPPQTDVAVNEVVRAVRRGDISESAIDRSVEKILLMKTRVGLHKNRIIEVSQIASVVASPESQALAQRIADHSITLVRNRNGLLPLNPLLPRKIFSLVMASHLNPSPGAVFQEELRRRFGSVETASVDLLTSPKLSAEVIARASQADVIICSTIVRVVSSKGHVDLPENQRTLMRRLLATGKPVIWIAFGNPYLLRLHPRVGVYLCTFSYSDVSQIAAAKAMSGEISLSGRLPISIPKYAKFGDGLQLPRLDLTLKSAAPETAGLPKGAFHQAKELLESYVRKRAFPGAALAVGYRGSLVLDTAAGHLDYSPGSAPVDGETIYDLASLSKVIGTTTAAMLLDESKRLLLDSPVRDYIPEFRGAGKERVRVRQLLLHAAGMPAYRSLYRQAKGYLGVMARVYAAPLEYAPGSKTQYSDLGMILLGELLTRVAGRPLDQFLAEHLFGPLGMRSTAYNPPPSLLDRIAPTENDPWRGRVLRGEVHDENAFAMGGVAGHSGLFSTTHDLARFAQMLLNGGMYDHRRYLSPETISRFTANQSPDQDGDRGLGWKKPSPANWTGDLFSAAAFGHTGFTGTSIWIDPSRNLFIILLSNRVHPTRENTMINEVRRVIARSVLRAVKKAKRR